MQRRFFPILLTLFFSAIATTAGAEVCGPIKVSPGGRHFVDRTGKPFFWLGDTAWPLFTRYSPEQAAAYLKHRRSAVRNRGRRTPSPLLPWLTSRKVSAPL